MKDLYQKWMIPILIIYFACIPCFLIGQAQTSSVSQTDTLHYIFINGKYQFFPKVQTEKSIQRSNSKISKRNRLSTESTITYFREKQGIITSNVVLADLLYSLIHPKNTRVIIIDGTETYFLKPDNTLTQ